MRFQALVGTIAALVLLTCAACADEATDRVIARIEGAYDPDAKGDDGRTLADLMKRYKVPGVSVAVISDFKIAWSKGYGIADVATEKPVDSETLFQAASISKPVNAMAVLKAIQDGKFGLDDDINSVLTSWTLPENEFTKIRKVTPRMLMSHTSGTDDGFGFPGYRPDTPRPTLVQILDGAEPSNVGPVRVGWEPFTRSKYSGGGVVMMQLALMDAVGLPYAEIMQDYVLGPAGMTHSTFAQPLPPELDDNAARAHISGKAKDAKWHVYPEQAAAGLWTTAADLCKFAIEVQLSLKGEANHVLSQDSVREMVTPVGIGGYGVGWRVQQSRGEWLFGHGGNNWGFISNVVAHREKGFGMAVMTNSSGGRAITRAIQKRISRAYEWGNK
ncbi:MAG: beta-lactamase family protein [Planctomycetes bacterium]|nr:beta-lactamase family protein [Planctomycetota bacterium]